MVVHGVHLAESRTHLSNLGNETHRQRGECDVPLFEVDSLFAERNKEIAPGVWVDDGLESHLRLMHLKRRDRFQGDGVLLRIAAERTDEVPNDADVGVESLGGRSARAAQAGFLHGSKDGCRGRSQGRRRLGRSFGWRCGWYWSGLSLRGLQHANLALECDDAVFQFAHTLLHGRVVRRSSLLAGRLLRKRWKSEHPDH